MACAMSLLETRKSIGLLITDLRMAPFDGLDLIRQVRESDRAALPIIIVSGDADVHDAIAAMHLSVVDFLLKPMMSWQLLKLVKRELGIDGEESPPTVGARLPAIGCEQS